MANGAAYGPSTGAFFASFNPHTSSWRMFPRSGTSRKVRERFNRHQLQRYWATWPKAGMMRNGLAFTHDNLAFLTIENESSFLPTPMAAEWRKYCITRPYAEHRNNRQCGMESWIAVALLCTNLSKGWVNVRFLESMMG